MLLVALNTRMNLENILNLSLDELETALSTTDEDEDDIR